MATLNEAMCLMRADPHPLLVTSLLRTRKHIESSARRRFKWIELGNETTDPLLLAEFHVSNGELTEAFARLSEAADAKHYRLAAANMFPQFEALRDDARYGRLLNRIGLRS